MENLYSKICTSVNLIREIDLVFDKGYGLHNSNLDKAKGTVNRFLETLRSDLHVYLEYPYVDKSYRDTYYNYFASKRDSYARNCIRLSFFSDAICDGDFRTEEGNRKLQSVYVGFLVIRPTFPSVVGRNVFSPEAFRESKFQICRVNYSSSINGLKLNVRGFPHSSQDGETITCAETTVWSLLEYFGNKYAEYRPHQPSEVNEVLSKFSFERLLPSKGLTAGQISYALREFGFGVKIYSRKAYKSDLERLLRIYVESGIPVVAAIQNSEIGHALNIVGRSNPSEEAIRNLQVAEQLDNNLNIYDFADLDVEYVFVDDNYSPYRLAPISNPVAYYNNAKWKGCAVNSFIAPLYPKIYMDAGEARKSALSWLNQLPFLANKDILIKTFLASSRSFKHFIVLNQNLDSDIRELLAGISMPKFVWVIEISDKSLILKGKASGMIIIDATEPKRFGIIAALIEGHFIAKNLTTFSDIAIKMGEFDCYTSNLQ